MLLTAVLCDGKKGKTPGARERVSPPFPLSGLPAPPALRPVDGAHWSHRAGALALRGGRHPQRCRLAGLCEGWAGVRAFWPAVSPGCRGDILPCPCCNSCCPGGCRALWPAHRRPLPAFQGAVVLWTPAAKGGLARPVAGGVAPAASRPLGAAGGGAIWALWHCRFYPAGRMEDPRVPCWTSTVSWTASP